MGPWTNIQVEPFLPYNTPLSLPSLSFLLPPSPLLFLYLPISPFPLPFSPYSFMSSASFLFLTSLLFLTFFSSPLPLITARESGERYSYPSVSGRIFLRNSQPKICKSVKVSPTCTRRPYNIVVNCDYL